jgi:hypothetical protein
MDIIGDENDPIKMFCLDEDDYEVAMQGTDTGTMDYSIRFFNEDENLEDERNFMGVSVTEKTVITTDTVRDEATILYIDADGDGEVDRELKAGPNETVEDTSSVLTRGSGSDGCNTGNITLFVLFMLIPAVFLKKRI